jgi:hypothetical protein
MVAIARATRSLSEKLRSGNRGSWEGQASTARVFLDHPGVESWRAREYDF